MLLEEANAEMVFRHSDIHPLFVKLTAERNEALSECNQLRADLATERTARESAERVLPIIQRQTLEYAAYVTAMMEPAKSDTDASLERASSEFKRIAVEGDFRVPRLRSNFRRNKSGTYMKGSEMSRATEEQIELLRAHERWFVEAEDPTAVALRALLAERAELLKALRPFADLWRRTPAHIRQWALTSGQSTLKVTVDDYARAAAALDAAVPKSEEKPK